MRDTGDVGDPPRDARVEVREVSRSFGRVLALDRVSLLVRAGEIHGLLGPNGAGKTTLLRVLTGLVDADSGHVRVAGCDPARSGRALRARVGTVPSGDRSLYLRVSGIENLVFFARLQGLRRRAATAEPTRCWRRSGSRTPPGRRSASTRTGCRSDSRWRGRSSSTRWSCSSTRRRTTSTPRRLRRCASRARPGGTRNGDHLDDAARGRDQGLRGRRDAPRAGPDPLQRQRAELMAHALPRRYLLRLLDARGNGAAPDPALAAALAGLGSIERTSEDATHFVMSLEDDASSATRSPPSTRPASSSSPAATSAPKSRRRSSP